MRVIAIRRFGGVDVLEDEVWPIPEPAPGEVRIRISAASFNPIDLFWRAGRLDRRLPVVLGRDFSGAVEATGDGVSDLAVGDVVFGYQAGSRASNGTYAEYMCLPAELVARAPAGWPATSIAALPVAALTAQRCVVSKARVQRGDSALVAGAAGGVGSMIVQMLMLAGASPILATAGSHRSAAYLTGELGLKRGWVIHYAGLDEEALVKSVRDKNGGQQVDHTFDTAGGAMKRLAFHAARVDGNVVSIVEEPPDFPLNIWDERTSPMSQRSLSFHFVEIGARAWMRERATWLEYRRELDQIARWAQAGQIAPPPVRVMGPLAACTAREAHTLLETGHAGGKLVMTIGDTDGR